MHKAKRNDKMPYVNAEITADDIADLMNEDANFMRDMFETIANRAEMGLLADNLSDLSGSISARDADFLSNRLAELSRIVRDGFNMANINKI